MGMYLARSIALRSADLSRQVGAVIASESGDLISVGCNEVPKAMGGLYWPNGDDHRDFQKGYDSSAKYKVEIIQEIIAKVQEIGWFKSEISEINPEKIVEELLYGAAKEKFYGAQILNLLEFGRTVHAEMAAITDAARRGLSLAGSTLYSTTFPCHMCARHILSAGIKSVIYIEPYPKSMAEELYEEAICVDQDDEPYCKVNFVSFTGLAPRRFQEFFEAPDRKGKKGKALEWNPSNGQPRVKRLVLSHVVLESVVLDHIPELLGKANMKVVT